MLNQKSDEVLIVSAYKSDDSAFWNRQYHQKVREDLYSAGIPFEECLGKYAGSYEKSFIIPFQREQRNRWKKVWEIVRRYNQESIARVSRYDVLTIQYSDMVSRKLEVLGTLKRITRKDARKAYAFTCVIRNGETEFYSI